MPNTKKGKRRDKEKKLKEKNTTKQRVLFYQILSIREIKEKKRAYTLACHHSYLYN